jgi:hypothetical protein
VLAADLAELRGGGGAIGQRRTERVAIQHGRPAQSL